SIILTRCHFGLVVNGTKMLKVVSGELRLAGLNWLGVTTNFVILTSLSAAGGMWLCVASFGWSEAAGIAGLAVLVLLPMFLGLNHRRANRLCRKLDASWNHGSVSMELREKHTQLSLDATASDISVIVTMAAALFAGFFNAMTNLGGIPPSLVIDLPVSLVKRMGVPICSGYLALSLVLSARMVLRLRLALAEHAARLAELRQEPDDPWGFKILERSFLLYLLVCVLACASLAIFGWSVAGMWTGLGSALLLLAFGLHWYPRQLRKAGRAAKPAVRAREMPSELESVRPALPQPPVPPDGNETDEQLIER
ncbi:MAG: hypothetical protein ACE5F1_21390, partial [Planctomycetota bacterium]